MVPYESLGGMCSLKKATNCLALWPLSLYLTCPKEGEWDQSVRSGKLRTLFVPITITEVTSSSQSSRFSNKLNVKRRVITQKGASNLTYLDGLNCWWLSHNSAEHIYSGACIHTDFVKQAFLIWPLSLFHPFWVCNGLTTASRYSAERQDWFTAQKTYLELSSWTSCGVMHMSLRWPK